MGKHSPFTLYEGTIKNGGFSSPIVAGSEPTVTAPQTSLQTLASIDISSIELVPGDILEITAMLNLGYYNALSLPVDILVGSVSLLTDISAAFTTVFPTALAGGFCSINATVYINEGATPGDLAFTWTAQGYAAQAPATYNLDFNYARGNVDGLSTPTTISVQARPISTGAPVDDFAVLHGFGVRITGGNL